MAARLARRLEQQQQLRRMQLAGEAPAASNIVAAPLPQQPAAAPAAATTVVRVCTGKKCAAAGAAALLQQYARMPGVVASPTKCLKQCRRCVAVEMAGGGCPGALYTGVNAANAAGVLAMHHQQRQPAAPAPAARP